jgi:predicted Zn-dependent protease
LYYLFLQATTDLTNTHETVDEPRALFFAKKQTKNEKIPLSPYAVSNMRESMKRAADATSAGGQIPQSTTYPNVRNVEKVLWKDFPIDVRGKPGMGTT